jgi:hypothetical protein
MLKKNNVVLAVGIGIFGLIAILIVLRTMPLDTSGSKQDTAVLASVFGTIRLPEGISQFEADSANGSVRIEPGIQAERLPVGEYHVRFWKTERKDEQGNSWALSGQYYGRDNPFEIKEATETKLDVGEPIIATVDARNTGSNYSFNQVIKGRHKEIIELTCNGSRPQPPKLHIKNEDGSYDKTFDFRYG